MSQLGHQCHWAGVLADDAAASMILQDLQRHAIDFVHSETVHGATSPVSLIVASQQNASRTITHYRDLPEYSLARFQQIELSRYDWLHVEGRDVTEVRGMLQHARSQAPRLRISLELEKPREDIESLITFADVVMCSGVYARHHGDSSSEACVHRLHTRYPKVEFTCTWGSAGASAIQPDGSVQHAGAVCLEQVIDSRAAGDVFNAAYIDACLNELSLQQRLQAAVVLAGRKCGQLGIDNLVNP